MKKKAKREQKPRKKKSKQIQMSRSCELRSPKLPRGRTWVLMLAENQPADPKYVNVLSWAGTFTRGRDPKPQVKKIKVKKTELNVSLIPEFKRDPKTDQPAVTDIIEDLQRTECRTRSGEATWDDKDVGVLFHGTWFLKQDFPKVALAEFLKLRDLKARPDWLPKPGTMPVPEEEEHKDGLVQSVIGKIHDVLGEDELHGDRSVIVSDWPASLASPLGLGFRSEIRDLQTWLDRPGDETQTHIQIALTPDERNLTLNLEHFWAYNLPEERRILKNVIVSLAVQYKLNMQVTVGNESVPFWKNLGFSLSEDFDDSKTKQSMNATSTDMENAERGFTKRLAKFRENRDWDLDVAQRMNNVLDFGCFVRTFAYVHGNKNKPNPKAVRTVLKGQVSQHQVELSFYGIQSLNRSAIHVFVYNAKGLESSRAEFEKRQFRMALSCAKRAGLRRIIMDFKGSSSSGSSSQGLKVSVLKEADLQQFHTNSVDPALFVIEQEAELGGYRILDGEPWDMIDWELNDFVRMDETITFVDETGNVLE